MNTTGKLSGRCPRCETLPNKIEEVGKLYVWLPLGHSFAKVIQALKQGGFTYQLLEDGQSLSIVLEPNQAQELGNCLVQVLTTKEQSDTRVLFMSDDTEPQLQDFSRVTTLSQFMSLSQASWLIEMLSAEQVTSFFQPIVYTEDTSRVFAQEALFRGLDEQGQIIPPGRIFSSAQDAGLLFQLDMIARRSAIRQASRHKIKEHIFINFTPTSIYDPAACLQMTVRSIDEAGIPHKNVVFEVIESDQPQDINHLRSILDFYREAGFLVALDDFGAGYSNLNLIHQLRPDFIKLDMHLLRNVHQDSYKALITSKILEITQQLEIKTIAEGIESIEELQWVREHGATFVQGYLIARPAQIPVTTTCAIETGSLPAIP